MTRVYYLSSYFVPLFATNSIKTIIVSSVVLLLFIISITLTALKLFPSIYIKDGKDGNESLNILEDENRKFFIPDSQDYFRILLLSFISPLIFQFFSLIFLKYCNSRLSFRKKFNNNNPTSNNNSTSNTHLFPRIFVNFIINFVFTDLFQFLILCIISFPQINDVNRRKFHTIPLNSWNLLPRLSVLYAIAWSISELLILFVTSIHFFKEVDNIPTSENLDNVNTFSDEYSPLLSSSTSSLNDRSHHLPVSQSPLRKKISLSNCTKLRLSSSSISNNIYKNSTLTSNLNSPPSSAGTKTNNHNSNNNNNNNSNNMVNTSGNNKSNFPNNGSSFEKQIAIVSSVDNSLSLQRVPDNGPTSNYFYYNNAILPNPNLNYKSLKNLNGSTDSFSKDPNNSYLNGEFENNAFSLNFQSLFAINRLLYPFIRFPKIKTKKQFFKGILIFLLCLSTNFLLIIGEALIMSIYFIFTPNLLDSEKLKFSKIMIYFGSQKLFYFIIMLVLPFIFINCMVNTFIHYNKQVVLWNKSDFQEDSTPQNNDNTIMMMNNNEQDSLMLSNSLKDRSLSSLYTSSLTDPHLTMENYPNFNTNLEFNNYYMNNNDYYNNYVTTHDDPFLIRTIKTIYNYWERISVNDSFVIFSNFLWALIVFGFGWYSTRIIVSNSS
ncbi:hypothetical protein TBLA_0F02020 [Henningerozyma blattae CBS 6284]|uniref:Uncharacterized protein n=1 Tax=Henningerozyma blattae (strain ATCC 34711 / CBS 6284 / DSM 70876 / NBRC 10599 / NRRL Y-10934 / UCD 77-7) TaxID=1071380 RepID=I2H5U2_HENB6|nr:hypothetical protein TBLA_0F02020 [Tetrapisispora blattae CBS 6284]CCH61744.1 hypothetical protein TBLA_0F02020 [Tetrapisispora blattae CBS 6284]